MKKLFLLFIIINLASFFVFASEFPKISGFRQIGEVRLYTPGTLWEYINGAADQFLDYEFQLLRSSDFSGEGFSVSVDIYQMSSPLTAYGIYTNERPSVKEKLPYGIESVVSPPYQALLLKGDYYVKINVLEGELNEKNGILLLEAVADALEGSKLYPKELNLLPQKNMVEGSQKYANKVFLALKELNKCIYADYFDGNENKFQYFVVNSPSKKMTKSIWGNLSKKWKHKKTSRAEILFREIPYQGPVGVIMKGEKIYGVTGLETEEETFQKLEKLLD